jgi:membrane protease YdiL (CAAX protease family)
MTEPREESPVRFGVLVAIGVTLLFQFGQLGLQLIAMRSGREDMLPFPLTLMLSQLALMLVPVIYAARAQELPARSLFRLERVDARFHLAVVLGVITLWPIVQTYLMAQELYLIPNGMLTQYREIQDRLQGMYEQLLPAGGLFSPVVGLLAGALVPAICEEAVFRGAAQRSFERRMRPGFAILLSALLFASLHLQPQNFVPLLLLGAFLGLAAWSSGSLFPSIVGHFFFNAVMIGLLYSMRQLGSPARGEGEAELKAMLPAALVCLPGFVLVVRWLMLRGRSRSAALIMGEAIPPPSFDPVNPFDER